MIHSDFGFPEVVSYLARSGWRRSLAGDFAEIWQYLLDENVTVMVPKVETAPDFNRTVQVLTRELAQTENRNASEIEQEILRQFLDVTDLRAQGDEIADGTIPLGAGINLFNSANRLMVSAAAATINRKGYYGRSIPHAAHDHARRLRLGQTRPGSYVVPIISNARFGAAIEYRRDEPRLDIQSDDQRFDRRVLTTLSRALETLAEMTTVRDRLPSTDDIISSVDEGVSSELCSAVLGVIKQGVSTFDVSFKWAPAAPVPVDLRDHVEFTNESVLAVDEVKSKLKKSKTPTEQVVFGVIRRLSLSKNEDKGTVHMETAIHGKSRMVSFTLDLQTYRRAALYHGERRPVVVTGTLDDTPGKGATMKVRSFSADRSVSSFDDVI
ncbi:hypothetical protein [Streptomyces sp. NBC_01477]|uniref:hypothetical protein n=1 Tax=Streptomyces sp. NBC_01477 TaxID=2976015 RepID=UPI002E334AB3|nr:hypothetical protein [Streptomyces sp. NBC_01477]